MIIKSVLKWINEKLNWKILNIKKWKIKYYGEMLTSEKYKLLIIIVKI